MKTGLWILISIIVLLTQQSGFAVDQTVLARVTVYWHGPGKQQYGFFKGIRLRNGHCAVDPKRIPFGSEILFPDGPCLAVDTGPAVVSRQAARLSGKTPTQRSAIVVDRYFESKKEALAWANSHPHFFSLRVLNPSRLAEKTPLPDARTSAANAAFSATRAQPTNPPFLICSKHDATMPSLDIRGPLIPAFLLACLPDS